ncbi:Uncharacterized protein APZ42_004306, partial [Daphnia magna]
MIEASTFASLNTYEEERSRSLFKRQHDARHKRAQSNIYPI